MQRNQRLSQHGKFPPTSPVTPAHEGMILLELDPYIKRSASAAARSLGAGPAHADDLAQLARVKVWRAARRRETSPRYVGWAITYALRNGLRQERRGFSLWAPEFHQVDDDSELGEPTRPPEEDVHAMSAVSRWVAELPSRQQEVFDLLYRRGATQREAAALLGVSQPRIAELHQQILRKGRSELRQLAA